MNSLISFFSHLIRPEVHKYFNSSCPIVHLPWLLLSPDDQQTNLQHLSHVQLTDCLCTIGLNPEHSRAASSVAIVSHFCARCVDLEGYYNSEIAADIHCLVPFVSPPSTDDRPALLHRILQLEYGIDVFAELQCVTLH
jgi:hypothetical protein